MNMLPPARPGVSSSPISCRTRATRPGLSARTRMLFERGSAMTVTRCCASGAPAAPTAPGSASSRFRSETMSSADAFLRGTRIGSRAGGLVERRDDPVDPPEVVRVVGDDQRVAAGIRGDRVVRRDQRPQHVDELRRRFVPERDDLGDQPVAAGRHRPLRHRAALLLGVGLRNDLHHPVALDRGEALQAQRGEQRRVDEALRHRPGRDDVDGPLDLGIDEEIAPGDLGDRLDHRLDVRVDEVERDRIVGRRRDRREAGRKREYEDDERPQGTAGRAHWGEGMHRSTQSRGQTGARKNDRDRAGGCRAG